MNTNVIELDLFDRKANNENTKRFNNKVYNQITRFLREHRSSSKNTSKSYETDIRQFFNVTRDKDIEHLNKSDLVFTIDEFEDYKFYLIDNLKLSSATVNRHLASISTCFNHLFSRGKVEDIRFLNIRRPKIKNNSHDGLTHEEVMKAADYVATTGRKKTGRIKRLLILYAYDTCSRKEECLNLKWSDFGEKCDRYITVKSVAKGNKIMNRRISLKMYNDLLSIKEDGKDRVFNIGSATVDRMIPDIRRYLGIRNNRQITFHSFRKAGAQHIYEKTRDINQVSKALGHESIQTSEIYIDKNEDYGVVGAISSLHGVDDKLYKQVSHHELLSAIEKLGSDKRMHINLQLDKQINKDK